MARNYYYRKKNNKRSYRSYNKKKGNRYEKKSYQRAPTRKTGRNADQVMLYRTPIFSTVSKYIKEQLYYDEDQALIAASGTMVSLFWIANDMYDPDTAVGYGHQPIGFDQMILLYNHFCVFRSKVTITFSNGSTYPVRAGVCLSPDAVPASSIAAHMENGLLKSVVLDPIGSDGAIKKVSLECDVKKYFGKNKYKDLMDDAALCGDSGHSPLEKVYYNIFCFNPFNDETVGINFDITLSYDCIYFEPRKLNNS